MQFILSPTPEQEQSVKEVKDFMKSLTIEHFSKIKSADDFKHLFNKKSGIEFTTAYNGRKNIGDNLTAEFWFSVLVIKNGTSINIELPVSYDITGIDRKNNCFKYKFRNFRIEEDKIRPFYSSTFFDKYIS